jgi:hypothetical protein
MSADQIKDAASDTAPFEHTITLDDWKTIATKVNQVPIFQAPIVTLSPTKTVGNGRTNLTLIRPTILQTDATTPYAAFDAVPGANPPPGVSVHFTPSAYGITATGTYVFSFKITTYGAVTIDLDGFPGAGAVEGEGSHVINGNTYASIVLHDVPADQTVYASASGTSGASWSWFSTSIGHPPLVFLP